MKPLSVEQVESASGEQLGVVIQVGVRFKAVRRWQASGFRTVVCFLVRSPLDGLRDKPLFESTQVTVH